jgi:hypothetical protein
MRRTSSQLGNWITYCMWSAFHAAATFTHTGSRGSRSLSSWLTGFVSITNQQAAQLYVTYKDKSAGTDRPSALFVRSWISFQKTPMATKIICDTYPLLLIRQKVGPLLSAFSHWRDIILLKFVARTTFHKPFTPEGWYSSTKLQGVTFQKTVIFTNLWSCIKATK